MTIGPLRRLVASLGLLGLVPITWLLATGGLSPEEAALRAVIVSMVVVALGRVLGAVLTRQLRHLERRATDHRHDRRYADGRKGDDDASRGSPTVSLGAARRHDDGTDIQR